MRFKQLRYVIFILICMCVMPLITHAECDYQRQAELARLASNVQLTYTYNSNSGFQVIMTNLTAELYAVDSYGQIIHGGDERTFDYSSGTVSFDIYAVDSACSTDKLLTKSLTLPTLNAYSYYDECKQFPNFKYCQLWGNFSVTHDQFMKELESYKQDMRSSLLSADNNSNPEILEIILSVLSNNSFMFIIFGCVIVIFIIYSKFKKSTNRL